MAIRTIVLKLMFLLVLGCSSHDGPIYPAAGSLPMGGACYSAYDCATGFCCTSPLCLAAACVRMRATAISIAPTAHVAMEEPALPFVSTIRTVPMAKRARRRIHFANTDSVPAQPGR